MAHTTSSKRDTTFTKTLTTMLHTSKMLGMAAAIYFLTSFERFSSFTYIFIVPAIILQAYRDSDNAVTSVLAGTTWILDTLLRHDVRAQLTTHLDRSFKIMDIFLLMVVFSHSQLGFSLGEYLKLRWRLKMLCWRKSSEMVERRLPRLRKVPFVRTLILGSLSGQAVTIDYSEAKNVSFHKAASVFRKNGVMESLVNSVDDFRAWLFDIKSPACEVQIDTDNKKSEDKQFAELSAEETVCYSTSPALTQIQSYTSLGDQQRLKAVDYSGTPQLASTWQRQWPRMLHMIALFTYGRILSCLPQMSCMKLRILVAGSLLFANEFEVAFNGGDYVRRHIQMGQFCFGSITSSFCVVAALMLPYASIGLGIGMPFIPCSTFVVALWTCVVERRRYLAGDHLGCARRFGAMVFAAFFALHLKVMDARSEHGNTVGINQSALTGFRPGM